MARLLLVSLAVIAEFERNNLLKFTIMFLRILSVGAAVGYALVSH
jgi:hypothetical protein